MLTMACSVSHFVACKAQRGKIRGGNTDVDGVSAFCLIKSCQEKELIVLATTDKVSEAGKKKKKKKASFVMSTI